jgi:hypothetical protein
MPEPETEQIKKVENVENIDTKRRARGGLFSEVGRSGIKRYGTRLYEEFLPNLRDIRGIKVYTEMRRNDPIVGAALTAIEQVIRSTSWFIEPGGDSNLEKEAAEHLKSCMEDMDHSWQDFLSDVLTFLPYGWSWCEAVYKIRKGPDRAEKFKSRFSDGLIGWRKLALRSHSSWHDWKYGRDDRDLVAMIQLDPTTNEKLTVPLNTSLLFRTKSEGGNPEGVSVLRTCYRPWYIKKGIEEIEAIGIERDLIGLPVVTAPENVDVDSDENIALRTKIQQMIYALRRDEQDGILFPYGWEIALLGAGSRTRRQFDTDRTINRYDKRIAVALLAQFIMLGMDRVGSFALSQDQGDLFKISIQGYLDVITEILNRFEVPRLFQLMPKFAGLSDTLPRFFPGRVHAPDLQELGSFIRDASDAGFLLPDPDARREVRRFAGFSETKPRRIEVLYGDDDNEGGVDGEDPFVNDPLLQQMRAQVQAQDKVRQRATGIEAKVASALLGGRNGE